MRSRQQMKHNAILVAIVAVLGLAADSRAVEPAYREIQASVAYGVAVPGGDWDTTMETGSGVALDLGVTLSPRFTAGFRGSVDSLAPRSEYAEALEELIGDNNWIRYTASGYGEYLFSHRRLSPFVGASLGMHGVDISYVRTSLGFDGSGDYGLGLGISAGVRYRDSERVGGVIRLDAENAIGIEGGWFYAVRGGVTFYL